MKKIYFLLSVCIITVGIQAQDTLKPINNRWGTELNVNPFNGTFSLNNASGQIKLRKFLTKNQALRLSFTINYLQNNTKQDNVYGLNPSNGENLQRSFMISVNAGKEKHFGTSRRISPYLGYDIGFGIKKSSESDRSTDTYRKVKGAWQHLTYVNSQYYYTDFIERGFWSIGANMISGIDIYIVKDFYIGYEIAYGFDYIKYSNIEITQEPPQSQPSPDLDDETWKFGPKLLNGIRIGYVF
jgi:hypothetical protein